VQGCPKTAISIYQKMVLQDMLKKLKLPTRKNDLSVGKKLNTLKNTKKFYGRRINTEMVT
jgi:hypothetical protein